MARKAGVDLGETLADTALCAEGAGSGEARLTPRRDPVDNAAQGAIQVGFLFNHDAVHQIAHCAPIIGELLEHHPGIAPTVLASSGSQIDIVRQIIGDGLAEKCRFLELDMPRLYDLLDRAASKVAPFRRYGILKSNLDVFRQFDTLVVPEQTSLMLKERFGLNDLKLVYTHHGAGDRAIGFTPRTDRFDFVLLSGQKLRDRLSSLGHIREGAYKIVGYPKFDTIAARRDLPLRLFPNDNPTVLYNPHFHPFLSSWYEMGLDVLEFFYQRPDFNLIFAPHVMLFERKVHASLEHRRARLRKALPEKYRDCSHILVDTGSSACVDMSYTLTADIYLGDVSSQVYEFLKTPKPCVFLNFHGAQWEGDPDYLLWQCGPVLSDLSRLDDSLRQAESAQAKYRAIQERLFNYTFDLSESNSAFRAADAIAEFVLARNG